MSELQVVADRVTSGTYWEVFPDPYALKVVYRRLAQVLHPDRYHGTERELATAAFAQLTALHLEAEQALAANRYGQPQIVIRTRKAVHKVESKFADGDLTALYRADTTSDAGTADSLIKVARSPKDNDLLAAEATALKRLHAEPDKLERHIPILLDTFIYQEGRRRANAIGWLDGFISLEQVRRAYPNGLDPRHGAWIWRRLLMGLGYAHDNGVLHGAVIPEHVLIEPKDHAVMLADWCYSSIDVDGRCPPIKAAAGGAKRAMWYPEEIRAKEPPTIATDLYMAAQTMNWLMRGPTASTAPRPMRAFFNGCTLTKQSMRPQNAWVLLEEFDALLERMGEPFHPRRWVELAVPTGVA